HARRAPLVAWQAWNGDKASLVSRTTRQGESPRSPVPNTSRRPPAAARRHRRLRQPSREMAAIPRRAKPRADRRRPARPPPPTERTPVSRQDLFLSTGRSVSGAVDRCHPKWGDLQRHVVYATVAEAWPLAIRACL